MNLILLSPEDLLTHNRACIKNLRQGEHIKHIHGAGVGDALKVGLINGNMGTGLITQVQAGNLYCAASVNSLADLTVHFIQRFFGKTIASHVERHFSHEIRQAYETSGFFEAQENRHPDEDVTQIQIWLQDNYQRDILFAQVAARFSMSVRTLNRRFKNALGQTPLDYLQEIRINIAKDLLKTSNFSISEIADKIGYQDTGYFTALFKKKLAITPNAYRETVRAKLFSTRSPS